MSARVFARAYVRAHVSACMHACVCACVMCLQYTIKYLTHARLIIIIKIIILYFIPIRHSDDFPSTGIPASKNKSGKGNYR